MDTDTVGSRLREFAKSRFKTLTAFGEAVGLAPSRVSDYVNDRNSPNPEQLQRFAEVGLNIHWLLTGIGEMDAPKPTGTLEPVDLSKASHADTKDWLYASLQQLTEEAQRRIQQEREEEERTKEE